MQFKSFDELSIQDNFIFEKVMREKSICKELLDCFVIFICTFPIFSGKRHKYTYTKKCTEELGSELGDGLTTIFLSTKAEMNDVSELLQNFLDYVDGRPPSDGLLQQMDEVVHVVKQCKEWRGEYMKLEMDRKKYWREGKEEGTLEAIIGMLREKLSVEMIARITNMPVDQVIQIGKEHALL